MPQDEHTNNDSSEANKNNYSASHAGLRWILIAGCILFLALLFLSIFLPDMSERVKFFTVNALSLLVLIAIVVQAYIYRRQWEAMEHSLEETRKMVDQNERVARAVELQAAASQISAKAAENSAKATEKSVQIAAYTSSPVVGLTSAAMSNLAVGQRHRIELWFKNTGVTPAHKVNILALTDSQPFMRNPDELLNTVPLSESFMAPQAVFRVHIDGAEETTAPQLEAINNGTLVIYLYGVIKFEDGAGNESRLRFCAFYNTKILGFTSCPKSMINMN